MSRTEPMRVAVIADSHFDYQGRFEECIRLHDWIALDISRRGISRWVHAGDVYERKSVPVERLAVAEFVQKLGLLGPGLIVRGNHDAVEDLPLLERLETEHRVTVVEDARVVELDGVHVAAMAWPRKANLLAMTGATAKEEGDAQAADALRAVLRGMGQQLAALAGCTPTLFLAHAMVRGSVTSTGQPLVGCDLEVGIEDLALVNADAYALGHIHKGQRWEIDGAPVVYPGSPRRTAFGEIEPKGYTILEWDEHGNVSDTFVEAPATPMVDLEGAYHCPDHGLEVTGMESALALRGAEFRLRYTVASDYRALAAEEAGQLRERLLAAGAVAVKVEPIVQVETRSRVSEVAKAQTTTDKMVAYWASKGFDPGPRRVPLLSKLTDIEEAVGARAALATTDRSVRLRSVRIKGFGPFRDFAVNFEELQGPLVAVTGGNGAGKSTLLELGLPGAMYRTTPTRGSLADLATDRNAMLEVGLVNGKSWTLRHLVDGVSRKSEAVVLNDAGESVLDSAKVSEFDTWSADHMPLSEVLYASQFGAQRNPDQSDESEGFVNSKPGRRKSVLLRMLGMERLERLAESARSSATGARGDHSIAVTKLQEEQARGLDVAVAEKAVAEAEQAAEAAEVALVAAQQALDTAKEDQARADRMNQEAAEEREILGHLRAQLEAAEKRAADLRARITNNETLLAGGDAIREATQRAEQLKAAIHDVELRLADAKGREDAWRERVAAAKRERDTAQARLKSIEEQLRGANEVREHAATAESLRERVAIARTELEAAEASLRETEGAALVGAEGRISRLRGSLIVIAEGGADDDRAPGVAQEALVCDDQLVRTASEHPALLVAKRKAAADERTRVKQLEQVLHSAESAEARVPALDQLEVQRVEAERVAKEALAAARTVEGQKPAASTEFEAIIEKHRTELSGLAGLLRRAEPLAQAEARIEELRPQAEAAEAEAESFRKQIAARPEVAGTKPIDLAPLLAEVKRADTARLRAVEFLSSCRLRLDEAKKSALRIDDLQAEVAGIETELADWTRLAADLGKDGLQAAEIDAAIDGITSLANELLHSCYGPRWTLRFDTQRLHSDGKRLLETLDIIVLDTEGGREARIETYSGGELALLSEAVALALTVVSCQRAGVTRPTLVRDETGAALDPTKARAYVQMLRKAADIVQADKILLVSHQPEVSDLCDARIALDGGASA